MITIGHCGACRFRNANGYCTSEYLRAEARIAYSPDEQRTRLLYEDAYQDGHFWVGEQFGCIHFAPQSQPQTLYEIFAPERPKPR